MKIDISIENGLYVATSEDLPSLFVANKDIIELFKEIPEVIKAIYKEKRKATREDILYGHSDDFYTGKKKCDQH